MSKSWTVDDAAEGDARVSSALWEENGLTAYGRIETITDRAEFAEKLRKEDKR